MNKEELLQNLDKLNMACLIFDDITINPLEIVIIVSNKKEINKVVKMETAYQVQDGNRNRIVRIFTYKELYITQWAKKLTKVELSAYHCIFQTSAYEQSIFWIYYSIILARRDNWLRRNTISILSTRLQLEVPSEENICQWFEAQVNAHGLTISKVWNANCFLLEKKSANLFVYWKSRIAYLFYRVYRQSTFKLMGKKAGYHKRSTSRAYIESLQKDGVLGEAWTEYVGNGSSGSTYIRISGDSGDLFLKGNAFSSLSGIQNEINAHKKIRSSVCDKSLFINAIEYNEEKQWISFPFINYSSLASFVEIRKLNKKEMELLGDFLIRLLDELYKLEIVHNDIRLANILVELNDKDEIVKFALTDFGCYSSIGETPWDTKQPIAKLYCGELCGNSRYNNYAVDDAASAYYLYQLAGESNSDFLTSIQNRIGKSYSYIG